MRRHNIERQPFFPAIDMDGEAATAVQRMVTRNDLYSLHEADTSLLHGIGHASISITVREYLEQLSTLSREDQSASFSEGFGAYEVFTSLIGNTRRSVVRESQSVIAELRNGEVLDVLTNAIHAAEKTNKRTVVLLAQAARLYSVPHEDYFIAGGSIALRVDTAARLPDL
jgi:3-methyladenine DNA glycosylase AlkD